MKMKAILFNTDMVRAILDGRKTVTRRVVKPQPSIECSHGGYHEFIRDDFTDGSIFTGFVCKKCGCGVCGPHFKFPIGTSWIRPPYRPGDILYVRETWTSWSRTCGTIPRILYKADRYTDAEKIKWRPSIHMPREASRLFLRVTDVRVERLQDISSQDIEREGIDLTDLQGLGCVTRGEYVYAFQQLWDSTINPKDRALYGLDANPWVWVVEFEIISREEAGQ